MASGKLGATHGAHNHSLQENLGKISLNQTSTQGFFHENSVDHAGNELKQGKGSKKGSN
jgi:hypothetical protein